MTDFLTRLCLVGAAALFAAWLVLKNKGRIARAADELSAIPFRRHALFLAFVAVAAIYGGAKNGTNEPPQGASPPMLMMGGGITQSVSAEDAVHGYRLESESTNETYSYAMPTNGARCESWWIRGAYEDVFRLDLDGLLFPLGTNLCDSLWVYTWGMAGARLDDASNRLVAAGVPMSAVPQLSQFWSAETDGGGRLLTWQDFALDRDTNTPVSAQLELMPSGDFIARSNEVERVYRRVNPDDWDDDGIPNDDDIDPLVYDGDNFGPHQQLPEGANSNAYCWVDLVVPDANAIVTFAGDGYSALPDPTFVAKAGATNRVILLIGKTYQVTSRMPIVCIGQSSGEIDVDQVSSTELSICWPVTIEASAMRSGASFAMTVVPNCLGGGFTWTNGCCAVVSLGGWRYGFTCAENCLCTGCGAEGYYGYEAYRLPANGGACGCSSHGEGDTGDDEEPPSVGVSVSFSKDAVIFEDAYVPSPGESVQKRSTTVKLRVSACGGPNGGTVSFTTANLDKLSPLACGPLLLPSNLVLGPMATYSEEFNCEGAVASGTENDIVVSGSFVENVTGDTYDAQDRITVFRVEIRSTAWPVGNECINRHKYGVRELVNILRVPTSPSLIFSRMEGGQVVDGKYQCPLMPFTKPLDITYGSTTYTPHITVVAPDGAYVDDVVEWIAGLPNGVAGGVGMSFSVFLSPVDVSFSGIKAEEVPCYIGSHEGYFNHSAFEADWYHTRSAGAGKWQRVRADNYYGVDMAVISNSLPRMTPGGVLTNDVQFAWRYGSIVWQVPMGWGELSSVDYDDPAGRFQEEDTQEMVIFANGKCGVRKFRHMVTREIDGTVNLDGRQVR